MTGVDVPRTNGGISPCREKDLAHGVCGHGRDGSCVALEELQTAARVKGPRPCGRVRGARDQYVSGIDHRSLVIVNNEALLCWNENQGVDTLAVPLEGSNACFLFCSINQLGSVEKPSFHSLVIRRRENEISGAEQLLDPGRVTLVDKETLTSCHVPFAQGGVGRPRYNVDIDYSNAIDVARMPSNKYYMMYYQFDMVTRFSNRLLQHPYALRLVSLSGPHSGRGIFRARH